MIGVLAVGLGLGGVGQFVETYFATTWVADRQAADEVSEFRHVVADSPQRGAELHTDLAAFPPPVVDTSGDDAWGLLVVPSWRDSAGAYGEVADGAIPVKEGTGAAVLNSGAAGHYTHTVGPGEIGNMSLAAHRRTYGDSFLRLDQLQPGDVVGVETAEAWFVYVVTAHDVVDPSQWQVTAPVPGQPGAEPAERYLTLTTCHSLTRGAWGNDHRWVVHGSLLGWVEHDAGVPDVLVGA